MYTLRHTYMILSSALGLTKSGVKFMAEALQKSPDDLGFASAKKELEWLKNNSVDFDDPRFVNALDRIRDEAKKLSTRNETQKAAINNQLDTALDSNSGFSPEAKVKIQALKEEFTNDFIKLKEAKNLNNDAVKTDTRAKQIETRGEVGMSAQTEALVKILGLDIKTDAGIIETIKALKDVNIASMMQMIGRHGTLGINILISESKNSDGIYSSNRKFETAREKYGYSSNGAFGNTEFQSLMNFLDAYSKNTNDLQKKLVPVIASYESGQPSTEYLRAKESVKQVTNAKGLATFLADTPNARIRRDDLRKILESISDQPNFLAQINRLAGTNFSDTIKAIIEFKKSPELKAQFLDNLYAEIAIFEKGDNAGKVFTGKTLEAVKEKNEDINKLIDKKVNEEIARLTKEAKDEAPDIATKIEALIKIYQEKGASFFTGEIRRVGEGMMANIGEKANTLGIGMTWEAFIKGLTLTAGAAVGAGKGIGLTLHYDLLSGRTDSETQRINARLGAGATITSKFLPFIDAGVAFTDKVKTFGAGRGGIDTTAINAVAMKGGAVLTLTKLDARADEISQYAERLGAMIGNIAVLSKSQINDTTITELMKAKDGGSFKDVNAQGVKNFVNKLLARYEALPGIDAMKPQERAWVIRGVIQNEVEKMGLEEKMNDRDGRSYRGFSVGVGNILGITFPLAALHFGEYQVDYSYANKVAKTAKVDVKPQSSKSTESIKTRFDQMYDYTEGKDGAMNTYAFKSAFKPKTISIHPDLGNYDAKDGILRVNVASNEIVMQPKLSDDNKILESITVLPKYQVSPSVNSVRANNEGIASLSSMIYTMNRNPKYVSFNKAIKQISDQDYDGAYSTLQAYAKKDKNMVSLLTKLGADKDHTKLQAINTYTYGAEHVKNAQQVDVTTYEQARMNTIPEEKKLAENRWNQANEDKFKVQQNHTPKQLSEIYSGQNISVTVLATPKNGQPRFDKYEGSIQVSSYVINTVSDSQKDALIKEHAKAIEERVTKLKEFVGSAHGEKITIETYSSMLKTGVIPAEWNSIPEIAFQNDEGSNGKEKGPKFFEARAMAAGNVCMNKTEGIVYPLFTFKNKAGDVTITQDAPPPAPPVDTTSIDVSVGGVNSYDNVSTLGVSALSAKPEEKTTITTKPGEKEVITTKPGEVVISNGQVNINGKPIGVVNANGSITISTGTFRLAPGQTIEQFLGIKGISIPNQTVTTIVATVESVTSTSLVFRNVNQLTTALNLITASEINYNFTYPR